MDIPHLIWVDAGLAPTRVQVLFICAVSTEINPVTRGIAESRDPITATPQANGYKYAQATRADRFNLNRMLQPGNKLLRFR